MNNDEKTCQQRIADLILEVRGYYALIYECNVEIDKLKREMECGGEECKHGLTVDYSFQSDNGYGKIQTLCGLKCSICDKVNCYGQWYLKS